MRQYKIRLVALIVVIVDEIQRLVIRQISIQIAFVEIGQSANNYENNYILNFIKIKNYE